MTEREARDRLGHIYTLAEAAERMRLSKHGLAKIARRTGHCSIFGRTLLFSESDLLALWGATRAPTKAKESTAPLPTQRHLEARAAEFLAGRKRRN